VPSGWRTDGEPAGAEQDGVRLVAQLHGGVRHRSAVLPVIAGAGWRLGEAEFQAGRRPLDRAQDLERRCHHLGTDAVAGQHGNVERVVGKHLVLGVLRREGS
jgi:hypothetical protein